MPKIESVSVCTAKVPLDNVTSFSTRTVSDRFYGLVKVRSTDGVEGIGFCYQGSSGGPLVETAVRDMLARHLIGRDSLQVEALWERMTQESILQGRAGSALRAVSILDTALWDLNARSVKLSLHQLLGGYLDEWVPAYCSGGYYLKGKTPKMLAKEVAGFVKMGFKAVKIKVGMLSPREEEERIRACRDAIGPDVELMLDANNAWRDLPTALQTLRRFEKYNPYFIEEPFLPDDIDNHARLARATPIVVATGEIGTLRWHFKEYLEKNAAAILQTDAAVCGGITEWRRIAATAASYGATVSPHWFHDLHIHLVASTPCARYVEYFPDDQVLNFWRLIDKQLEHKNGKLKLHGTPGLGFKFDEKQIKKYALTPWTVIK